MSCEHMSGYDFAGVCIDCEIEMEDALDRMNDEEPTDAQLCYWGSRSELFAPPINDHIGD